MSDPKKVDGADRVRVVYHDDGPFGTIRVEWVPVKEEGKSSYTPPKDNSKDIWAKLIKTSPIPGYGWLDSEGKRCEPAHNRDCKAH